MSNPSPSRAIDWPAIDWRAVARLLLLSRELDTLEVEHLTPAGEVKYQFSAMGHELAQILLALHLTHPHDAATVYYRSRPFMLASGLSPREALAAGMARTGSPSEGRDVGVTFSLPPRTGAAALPMSGDVGAQYTPAAGWAQAILYRAHVLGDDDWRGAISVAQGGEGSVAANGFWAALNMATVLNLPLLFSVEDNEYGLSVPGDCQTPGGNIAANLACFPNLATFDGDGADPAEAINLISAAVAHVRQEQGPALLRLRVPRLLGHTYVDDQAYKPPEQRQEEKARDPLPRLRRYLIDEGHLTAEEWDDLRSAARAQLEHALDLARQDPEPDPATATDHLFFEGRVPDVGGQRREHATPPPGSPEPRPDGARINLIDAVRRTLETEMKINPRVLVFGEDVGVKGGVHGATRGMQARFGWERVFDTSLSEEGIVGRALGMAMAGLVPVPEIQFRKYADPATEQINDIGTLRWRTAGKFAAPMVIRIPIGYGKVTGDPWHSVSGEAILAHTLGWRIAIPSNAEDAVGLLRTALRGDDPTLFLEHRALLDTALARRPYPGDDYALPFGLAARLLQGDELTVVTWGAMVHRCLDAAQALLGRVDLLDLRTIVPWDRDAILNSIARTGKLLVVHEDTRTAGFAGEIVATIASRAFTHLDGPPARLTTPDAPIPYNVPMMNTMIPAVERIRAKMQDLLDF